MFMKTMKCRKSSFGKNHCLPYELLNDFYATNSCRDNMHGTDIFDDAPGCKWYDMETNKPIKTTESGSVFYTKNLHFKKGTKKRRYLYGRKTKNKHIYY